ncbi:Type 1 glutamine amidotransferase-like domain-containing protein [Paenibacillus sp. FSL W8-0426]|uniref:Type 1 glutamine amidotransferase-like domain-containing protein n=1 Tax=Paenibacillus sp. FSL W8-0426 TaxID=2921714 RepID=UPI0030DA540F
MAKLILLSDLKENDRLLNKLEDIFGGIKPSIAYIPSCSDPDRTYFKATTEFYNKIGIEDIEYKDLDEEYDEIVISTIFEHNAIHLSGGNTFYFLHLLRKRGFIDSLRTYVSNGGILIGVSAGSLLMTKTIELAGYGEDGDLNGVGLKDMKALGLVEFEFLPHWDGSEKTEQSISRYAKAKDITVYLCRDGDAVVVNNTKIEFIGDIRVIN